MPPGPQRGTQVSFVYFVSLLASVYVVTRLWTSTLEVTYLHRELHRLQQQQGITDDTPFINPEAAAEDCAENDPEALHFNIRPAAPPGTEILPLSGASLTSDPFEISPGDGSLIGQIESLESGEVAGWVCWHNDDDSTKKDLAVQIFVDNVLVPATIDLGPLPENAKKICQKDPTGAKEPSGSSFKTSLPRLPLGTHELRAFVRPEQDAKYKIELFDSPMKFRESVMRPDAEEALRRKDAIITRRNWELAALWTEVHTELPWKVMEAKHSNDIEGKDQKENPLLAAIIIFSEARSSALRNTLRQTWANVDKAKKLGIAIRFVIGRAYKGADESKLQEEISTYRDLIRVDVEDSETELPRKVLAALEAVTESVNAEFYFKAKDTVAVSLEGMVSYLKDRQGQGNAYMGCFKSGEVITDEEASWYEPQHARFGDHLGTGDKLQYPRHATHEFYGLSRPIARFLALNRVVLHAYNYEDTSMGAWLLGLDLEIDHNHKLCCASECDSKTVRRECVAFYDSRCGGVCEADTRMESVFKKCMPLV